MKNAAKNGNGPPSGIVLNAHPYSKIRNGYEWVRRIENAKVRNNYELEKYTRDQHYDEWN